jgi:Holliday junction resolvase RusA-like endonuclease
MATINARHGAAPIPGPVFLSLTFVLPRPRGHYGTGKNGNRLRASAPGYPDKRPDLDKLVRATFDGLTNGGAYRDDAQVVRFQCEKRYPLADFETPGALLRVEPLL